MSIDYNEFVVERIISYTSIGVQYNVIDKTNGNSRRVELLENANRTNYAVWRRRRQAIITEACRLLYQERDESSAIWFDPEKDNWKKYFQSRGGDNDARRI